jgi:glyoxylase-like metal-dependent hydrolase (beta-lactamase superfamily II)
METITIRLSVTNCYLIKVKEKFVLIDTGYEEDWELFKRRLNESGVGLSDISHIILTHHHDDHCGLLNFILNENNGITVVMSKLTVDLIAKGENDLTHGGGLINKRIGAIIGLKQAYISAVLKKKIDRKNNLKFPPYFARKNDILTDKETNLRDIGIDLDARIIETPGHTTDSVSILFDDGNCFVGDAAANFLQFAGTKYCVIFVTDLDEYYASWKKLVSENALRIFPAHGKPFSAAKLKKNIGKNQKRNIVSIE